MTSQAQAASPLPGMQGLVFLGFPLHPPGHPSDERGAHLLEIKIPMLFLKGTRDALAATELIDALVKRLGSQATLKLFKDADHSFHVPARSGRTDVELKCWTNCQLGSTIAQTHQLPPIRALSSGYDAWLSSSQSKLENINFKSDFDGSKPCARSSS